MISRILFRIAFARRTSQVPKRKRSRSGNSPGSGEALIQKEGKANEEDSSTEPKYREYICCEEALRISPSEPYVLRCPIRRGHLNISLHYHVQQVLQSRTNPAFVSWKGGVILGVLDFTRLDTLR